MPADDDTAAATAGPPAAADPQDPLPESNWKFRRYFVFGLSTLSLVALAAILFMLYGLGSATLETVSRLSATRDVRALDQSLETIGNVIDALFKLGIWLVVVLIVNQVLYLIAPSAEQATKMFATVAAWKGGISTASVSRSTGPDGSRAEAAITAGRTPAPLPVPAVEPAPASAAAQPTSERRMSWETA